MKKSIFYLVITTVILLIAILAWLFIKQSSSSKTSTMENSIVILPFSNDVSDKGNKLLVESSIKKLNDRVEIQVQIIDSITREQIWSKTFTGNENELPEIYEKIEKEVEETMILLK